MQETLNKEIAWAQIYGSVKVWPKGQVVIPNDIRNKLGISPWDIILVGTKHDKLIWLLKPEDIEEYTSRVKKEVQNNENLKEEVNSYIDEFKSKVDKYKK